MSKTEAVEPGLWLTQVPLDQYDVRGALILGDDRAVVWDTLARPGDMRPWLPLIGDRELVIVYSHADWDHIWGTGGLPHARGRVVAHQRCRARFDSDVPITLSEKQRAEPGAWDDVVLVPPGETFTGEWSVALGGLSLTLCHLPGHTPDCIVGFIPERGILLAGDTVETPCPVVPPGSAIGQWVAALTRWAGDARVRRVIPAHGAIGGPEILRQNIDYLDGIRNGRAIAPSGPLTPFYQATHQQNLKWQVGQPPVTG